MGSDSPWSTSELLASNNGVSIGPSFFIRIDCYLFKFVESFVQRSSRILFYKCKSFSIKALIKSKTQLGLSWTNKTECIFIHGQIHLYKISQNIVYYSEHNKMFSFVKKKFDVLIIFLKSQTERLTFGNNK